MTACKEAPTPATTTTTTLTVDSEEPLDLEHNSLYRSVVGKLQWEAPVRPGCAFAVTELARGLNIPTIASFRRLKHLLRRIKGKLHYTILLQPKLFIDLFRRKT